MASIRLSPVGQVIAGYAILAVLILFLPVLIQTFSPGDSFGSALDLQITMALLYIGGLYLGLIGGVAGFFFSKHIQVRRAFFFFALLCGLILFILYRL